MSEMKAVVRRRYGGPEVLRYEAVDVPEPAPDEVRIRVAYASVNPADRYHMLGRPRLVQLADGLGRPRSASLGIDVAGVVEAVGEEVTDLSPGDRVVAGSGNGYAQQATAARDRTARVPDEVSLRDAATLPVAGLTALQGWRRAGLRSGMEVLVNGASGGVGHFAVQLAVAAGATVTAVCSTRNLDLVRSFGAADVVDYTTTDYSSLGRTWDVLFDNHGNHAPAVNRDLLAEDGRWVLVNGPMTSSWTGPLRYVAGAYLAMLRSSRSLVQFTAVERGDDLAELVDHVAAGRLRPHVERTFPLVDLADAMAHLATNRTRGKLLVEVDPTL